MNNRQFNWTTKFLASFLILMVIFLSACGTEQKTSGTEKPKEKTIINIGVQGKTGILQYAREKKYLEKAFEKENVEIKWSEFTSGPPHFEAIASGKLDFGGTGSTPLIAGQAAGIDFRAIAVTGDGRKNYAVLVNKNSSYKKIEELKGKKVAVAPASGSYNFLYMALDKKGINDNNIQIIPLQPDEARAAFESVSVDAWAIWEPYLTTAVHQLGAKPILTSEELNLLAPGFLVARTKFTKDHPDYTELFLKIYEKTRKEYINEIDKVSKDLAKAQGVDEEIIREVNEKSEPLLSPITDEFAKAQQDQADFLYSQGVVKKKVDVSKVFDDSFVKNALMK